MKPGKGKNHVNSHNGLKAYGGNVKKNINKVMNGKLKAKDKDLRTVKDKSHQNSKTMKNLTADVSGGLYPENVKMLNKVKPKKTILEEQSQANSLTVTKQQNQPHSVQRKQIESNSSKTNVMGGESTTEAHKKRKGSKKKSKQDGSSNWMSLCSSLNISAKRKEKSVKRKTQESSEPLEPTAKKIKDTKDEIWFDNVDEIFIEASADKTSEVIGSEKSAKSGGEKTTSETDAKLIKPDSFPGMTQCVAMDCEMVGIGADGSESMLARVSIVNHFGVCLYDKFVLPREPVTDYRTFVSGVTKENLATGEEFSTVQKEVSDILKGRTLVGHAVHNDLRVLYLTHPRIDVRDTSQYEPFRELFNGRIPSLKKLSDKLLGVSVQTGQHSSVQDAQATMRLYTMYRQRWEKELKAKGKWKSKKKKKKNKEINRQ